MPRKRKATVQTAISNTFIQPYTAVEVDDLKDMIMTPKPRGRPKKTDNLDDATIAPVANGYIVRSTTTGSSKLFVFDDLDKAFDFIRTNLKPTDNQSEFLKKI